MTAPYGLPLIVTRADWLLSGPPILEALAAKRGSYDAAVIAVFGDPALEAAKLLLDVPVIGISEAAFHAAAMLGPPLRHRLLHRRAPADVRGLPGPSRPARPLRRLPHGPARCLLPRPARRGETAELLALIDQSIALDGAEAVILAGGPLAGLAALLQPSVGVPLVDGTVAAVRHGGGAGRDAAPRAATPARC